MNTSSANPRLGYGYSLAAAAVWSLTAPGLQYLLNTYRPSGLTLAFWRDAFIALACLAGLLLLRRKLLYVPLPMLRNLALTGMVSIGIYHALWLWSIELNGAAVAIVMIYIFPVFVTLGSRIFFGDTMNWQQVVAILVALLGCALLVRAYDPVIFQLNWLGTLVGICTALTHAIYVLVSQRSVQSYSPWTSLTYTMLFGSLTLLAINLLRPVVPGSVHPILTVGDTTAWLVLLGIALGPTLGGYALFTAALRHIPGPVASLVVVLEAPLSTLLSVLLVGARLEWLHVVGIGLILGAVTLPQLLARTRNPHLRTRIAESTE